MRMDGNAAAASFPAHTHRILTSVYRAKLTPKGKKRKREKKERNDLSDIWGQITALALWSNGTRFTCIRRNNTTKLREARGGISGYCKEYQGCNERGIGKWRCANFRHLKYRLAKIWLAHDLLIY